METNTDKRIILWGFEGQEILTDDTIDEAVESHLDDWDAGPVPENLEVNGYARENVSEEFTKECFNVALEGVHERLMERYGYEDEIPLDTDGVDAFEVAVNNLCKSFKSWSCEVVTTKTVNTKDWVEKNRPDWIKENVLKFQTNGSSPTVREDG